MYYGAIYNAELDPLGSNVGLSSPFATAPAPENAQAPGGTRWGDPFGGFSCRMDGFEVPCSQVAQALSAGFGVIAPLDTGPVRVRYNGKDVWAHFRAFADGFSGHIPSNARYAGNGVLNPAKFDKPKFKTRSPNTDTDLVKLNGASGNWINSGEDQIVLKNTGLASFWNLPSNKGRDPVQDDLLDFWRGLVDQAISRPKCIDFISQFAGGVDLIKVFDAVRVQRGFAFTNIVGGENQSNTETSQGSLIDLGKNRNWNSKNLRTSFENTNYMIDLLIHELIHAAFSGGSDFEMQDKVIAAGYKTPFGRAVSYNQMPFASMNWDSVLSQYCNFTQEEFLQWWKGK